MIAQTLTCGKCGAPIEVHAERARSVVCGSCRAQIDLSSPEHAIYGQVTARVPTHPLRVGWKGTLRGAAMEIVGYVRFVDPAEGDEWDEYLLVTGEGKTLWIQYEERSFTIFRPFVPASCEPVSPGDAVLVVEGRRHGISDQGRARITYIEGELTWRAAVGDETAYFDSHTYAAELGKTELEWFRVERVSMGEVASAFGQSHGAIAAGAWTPSDDDDDDEDTPAPRGASSGADAGRGALLLFVLVILFIATAVALLEADDDDDDDFDGRSMGGYSGGK